MLLFIFFSKQMLEIGCNVPLFELSTLPISFILADYFTFMYHIILSNKFVFTVGK